MLNIYIIAQQSISYLEELSNLKILKALTFLKFIFFYVKLDIIKKISEHFDIIVLFWRFQE